MIVFFIKYELSLHADSNVNTSPHAASTLLDLTQSDCIPSQSDYLLDCPSWGRFPSQITFLPLFASTPF